MKLHSLHLRGDEVVPRRFPCFDCRGGVLCDTCKDAEGIKGVVDHNPPSVDLSLAPVFNEEEGDNSDEETDDDEDDEDDDDDDDDTEDDDDAVDRIVWAPFG